MSRAARFTSRRRRFAWRPDAIRVESKRNRGVYAQIRGEAEEDRLATLGRPCGCACLSDPDCRSFRAIAGRCGDFCSGRPSDGRLPASQGPWSIGSEQDRAGENRWLSDVPDAGLRASRRRAAGLHGSARRDSSGAVARAGERIFSSRAALVARRAARAPRFRLIYASFRVSAARRRRAHKPLGAAFSSREKK